MRIVSQTENLLYAETTSLEDYDFAVPSKFHLELYDLDTDPHQLHNLANQAPPSTLEDLATRLQAAWSCRGATCRP